MTMLQAFVQVVLVALGLCKLNMILNRMVKAAQLKLSGFFVLKITHLALYNKIIKEHMDLDCLCHLKEIIMETLQQHVITAKDIKEEILNALMEEPI